MALSTLLRNLRTQRQYSAFATEDIQPMSAVFVTWQKLFAMGWTVGGALVIVSQGFTALQLEIFRMKMQDQMVNLEGKLDRLGAELAENKTRMAANKKSMEDNFQAINESMKAMNDKLTQALPKKR